MTLSKNVLLFSFCISHSTISLSLCKLFSSLSNIMRNLTKLNQRHNDIIIKHIIRGVILQSSDVLRCATRHL